MSKLLDLALQAQAGCGECHQHQTWQPFLDLANYFIGETKGDYGWSEGKKHTRRAIGNTPR